MAKSISDIKKEMDIKLKELRLRRKAVIHAFKEKLKEEKIKQIKDSF